jgi:hypothetical protein
MLIKLNASTVTNLQNRTPIYTQTDQENAAFAKGRLWQDTRQKSVNQKGSK